MVAPDEHIQTPPAHISGPQSAAKDNLGGKLTSAYTRLRCSASTRLRSVVSHNTWDALRTARTALLNLADARAVIPLSHYSGMPLLSVIVAAHNTQDYVGAALKSLAQQQWPEIEVLVVDDGSTDATAEVISRFVAKDPRFRLIQQTNVGLGAARNVGTRYATGRYLAFFDSDDIVNPFFYHKAIRSLEQSGSDFAIGSYELLFGRTRRSAPRYIHEAHQRTLMHVTLSDIPTITTNIPMWTRVYRRDFYDREVAPQPEGIQYEDQLPAMRGYVRSTGFDVLHQGSVQWRRRETQDSISQRIVEAENLRQRVQAYRSAADFLAESRLPEVKSERLTQILESDQLTLGQMVHATSEYFDIARDFLAWAIAEIGKEKYSQRVNMQDRVLHALILGTNLETTKSFLVAGGRNLKKWVLAPDERGQLLGYLPGWSEDLMADIPLEARRLSLRQRGMKRL